MTPTQKHIPARSRVAVLCLATLAVFVLAGCSNIAQPAPPQASLVVEATPMFASDEEALAAAEAAYRNYIDVSDQIARDGGAGLERVKSFVTRNVFSQDREASALYTSGNLHASGSTGVDSFRAQTLRITDSESILDAYVCLRFDTLRILDISENDVTPSTRSNNLPLVIKLVATEPTSDFLLSASEVWTGTNFC
ncbi:MAG: hypothetical protein JJE28_08380 [Actinomycetales bacterium]|nr:hypothetical protein [Actinomycetales bacterium]